MLPEGFVKNMKGLLGDDEYYLLEESLSSDPVQGLRLNLQKGSAEDQERLIKLLDLRSISYEDTGYYFDPEAVPGRRPYHDAGAYYIQDPSAMIPGALLNGCLYGDGGEAAKSEESDRSDRDELKILDLCAAPGGKSTQVALAMKGKGILFSNEINRSRAEILSRNIERMGITNAIVLNETSDKLAERFAGYFDAIVVDAPCSGEGMFRKDREAVLQWTEESVGVCADRQKDILENAYTMLRPGGVMVYSTCTFEREEDEDIVLGLMKAHPDMRLSDTSFLKCRTVGVRDGFEGCGQALRLWPMYFKGEGHFAALLEKDGVGVRTLPQGGSEDAGRIKDTKVLESFLKETLNDRKAAEILDARDRFRLVGDNLFIMPSDTPSLKGLKVLRCGLHIGTFKKDRFEPAHALALSLNEQDVRNVKRVSEDEAESFVKGMTLEGEGGGWCLVSLEGFSLGWGKASGGKVKNHYPKGLRIPG